MERHQNKFLCTFKFHRQINILVSCWFYPLRFPAKSVLSEKYIIRWFSFILTETYVLQIEGNVTQLTSYNEQTVATSSQRSDGIINVTIYDSYTALVTKGQNSGVNMDGFRPLPRSSLGSDYTVSAWPPSSGGYSFVGRLQQCSNSLDC